MNITFNKSLTMTDPALYIGKLSLSYTDMLLWGLFGLLLFIGLMVWIYTYQSGG